MNYAKLTPGEGFSPIRSLFYYSQRIVTIPALRRFLTQLIRAALCMFRHPSYSSAIVPAEQLLALKVLDSTGYVSLGKILNSSQCSDIHNYLRDKELSDRHNDTHKFRLADISDDVRLADYHLRDVVNCPHILEVANCPLLLRLAEQYIGCTPTISALGLRWSFPQQFGESPLQAFHRDADDWRFVKVMIYLTDVGLDEGPHMFVLGTHLTKATARLHFYSDDSIYDRHGRDGVVTAIGERGMAFAVDTAGIHKGNVPTRNARLMLQIQYSLLPNYSYSYCPEECESPSTFNKYINRLIVKNSTGN